MTLKAVIFDYKTIFKIRPEAHQQVQQLLTDLQVRGIRTCIFTTDPMDVHTAARSFGYPTPAAHVSLADVPGQKKRGSDAWIEVAEARLGLPRHEMLYVGATTLDWRTAINAGVFLLHAGWAAPQPPRTTLIVAAKPHDVLTFAEHFLLQPPRWSYRLDDTARRFSIRCLLPASARLPSTSPGTSFKLQDIFTYSRDVRVGDDSARDLLGMHAISSLYTEGLLIPNARFCVYPGSKRGTISAELEPFVRPAATLAHGYYKDDLLVRAVDAVDTSIERWKANQAGVNANISISNQASTVHIGTKYRGKLAGRTVIVFDDFTTTGMSLEWARNLLLSAGADRVVLLTIGKYSSNYTTYDPLAYAQLNPFAVSGLQPGDFQQATKQLTYDGANEPALASLFARAIQDFA